MPGPLQGVKVVEFAGIGPAPFCALLLADMGATVLRIERPGPSLPIDGSTAPAYVASRIVVSLDLKSEQGVGQATTAVANADVMIEGNRPGVMERLGLSPAACLARNQKLVYGRVTGWGQDGPLAKQAGHDLTYIALSGVLAAMGPPDAPPPVPLNLVGDFGGGGMLLAFGVVCALYEAQRSGRGQVVDAAMLDGATQLLGPIMGMRAQGQWAHPRGGNTLDGGAPFYRTYRCSDGKFIAVGAIEPQFYAALINALGLHDDPLLASSRQWDRAYWESQAAQWAALFATQTREHWCARLEPLDACVAPVLEFDEVATHPHNAKRGLLTTVNGMARPAPAPRFDRTPARAADHSSQDATDRAAFLRQFGL